MLPGVHTPVYTLLYHPGYTTVLMVLAAVCTLLVLCAAMMPWAQEERNPWVGGFSASQDLHPVRFVMDLGAELLRLPGE